MYVVELAVEGLSGFPARAQFGFRGHLDVVRLTSSEARSALVDVLFHTLFPDPDRADATGGLVDPGAPRRRAVLTLSGRDRVPYRMLRDLGSGRCRLYRFDRDRGSHELLSEDAREAHQFLRVQLQLPDDLSFERLFVFGADGRPSLGERARSRTGAPIFDDAPRPSGPGLPSRGLGGLGSSAATAIGSSDLPVGEHLTSMFPLPSVLGEATGMSELPSGFSMHNALVREELEVSGTIDMKPEETTEALQTRYRALRREREQARRAARAERLLGAIVEKQEAAEAVVRAYGELEQRRAAIAADLAQDAELSDLPESFLDRLDGYDDLVSRHHAEMARLEEERAGLEAHIDEHPPRPWHREPALLGGLAGVVLMAATAVLLRIPSLVLGQVLAGVLAGWGALRGIEAREAVARSRARVIELEERASKLERSHRLDTSTVRGLLDQLGERDVDALAARLRAHLAKRTELAEVEAEIGGSIRPRVQRAREILTRIASRKEECERALARHRGSGSSEESLDRRLEGLAAKLRERGVDVAALEAESGVSVVVGTADLPPPDDDDDDDDEPAGDAGWDGERWDASGPERSGGLLCASGGFGAGAGGYRASSGFRGGGFGWSGGGGGRGRPALLAETAADLVGQDLEGFILGVADRVGRYAKVLTSGAIVETLLDARGGLRVRSEAGELLAYEALEGAQLDQVDAALRFAFLESVLRVRRAPVVIEEPVAVLPPERRAVLRRIYGHLAQMAQVVVVSPADDIEGYRVQMR